MFNVTIVGAGFCGTMTAVQLLRTARDPLHIRLVERSPSQLGRGIAYSTNENCHLLNVRAGRMSALPDDPDHFVQWAAANSERISCKWQGDISQDSYLPRKYYGDYLRSLLSDAIALNNRHRIELVSGEVVRLDGPTGRTLDVHTSEGEYWRSDACVLALGNTAPTTPAAWGTDALPADCYHANPWAADVIPRLLQSDSCLLLGSGLTMLDIVMALDAHHYQGTVHVLSRRGLTPPAHATDEPLSTALPPTEALRDEPSVRALLAQLRQLSRVAGSADADWQAVVDALRPHTPSVWRRLSLAQQRRFLRHGRPYWDHHRHRVAPIVRQRFDELAAKGQIMMHSGRVVTAERGVASRGAVKVVVQTRGDALREISVGQLVNCTGPGMTQSGCNALLLRSLLGTYPTAKDPLGFGVAVTADMQLSTQGPPARIFVLGPPLKGHLWESTAVPECRAAVSRVVASLLNDDSMPTNHKVDLSRSFVN